MPVTADVPAPYAPASAVLEVIKRYRGGLPAPITAEVLVRAGISDSLIPRTLKSLQTLDLVNDDGSVTTTLEGLRRCPESEFQQRLADWLNVTYADVRGFVDPATAEETAIRDAFRNYNPVAQQPRMVSLFMGLYTAAGVRIGERAATTRQPRSARPARSKTPMPPVKDRTRGLATNIRSVLKQKPGRPFQEGTDLPEPIMGMLTRLPENGTGWTQEQRDKFLFTFGTVLDFCFPIVTADQISAATTETDDEDEVA